MWELLPDCKYIGEVGLDYNSGGNMALQKSFFEELIHKCNALGNKILSIHTRNSADDVISIIGNNFKGSAIMHWFTGPSLSLTRAIEQGNYFSINYAMCNSKKGKELILKVPKERILIETDAPFVHINNLSFTPQRIPEIIKRISGIWGDSYEKSIDQLWLNFDRLLRSMDQSS
jgi:TatD DNase family protein